MSINTVNLRNTAWIIGLIYSAFAVVIMLSMIAFSAPPWTLVDIFMTFVMGALYVLGLLIGKKWPLTGGIISSIYPITILIIMIYEVFRLKTASDTIGVFVTTLALSIFMLIPGFLYLISWYIQNKLDQNDSTGQKR